MAYKLLRARTQAVNIATQTNSLTTNRIKPALVAETAFIMYGRGRTVKDEPAASGAHIFILQANLLI
jgi:hypothetical protein